MELPFQVFTSYAHADNEAVAGGVGFVTACVDFLEHQLGQCLGERYSEFCDEASGRAIFRDVTGLGACDKWREELLQLAGETPLHLVFVSEAYFGSEACAREWCQHRQYVESVRQRYGVRHATSEVVVINMGSGWPSGPVGVECGCARRCVEGRVTELAAVNNVGFSRFRECRDAYDQACARQYADASSPTGAGTQAGGVVWGGLPGDALKMLVQIAVQIAEYVVERAARVASPTNCRVQSGRYVDRSEVVGKVAEVVFGPLGHRPVTLLYGMGGLGKTELAVAVAHEFAPEFPAGRWMVTCRTHDSVYGALAELATHPVIAPHVQDQPDLGRAVEHALHQLHADYTSTQGAPATEGVGKASMLLVCDDIDTVDIMASVEDVARRAPWLRVVATSRMDHSGLGVDAECAVEIPEMTPGQSVELLNRFVPAEYPLAGEGATEVAAALCGYTLVLEQAGAYIANSGGYESYRDYLRRLEKHGLTAVGDDKTSTHRSVAARLRHQQRLLSLVMESTFESVENAFTTTNATGSVGVGTGQMALAVLRMAALLPADHVSWDFLHDALARRYLPEPTPKGLWGLFHKKREHHDVPEVTDDLWTDIRTVLSQHRLIKDPGPGASNDAEVGGGVRPRPTSAPGAVGVMHALIQQHLTGNDRADLTGTPDAPDSGIPVTASDWRHLGDHLTNLCKRINNERWEGATPNAGERTALGRTLADIVDRLPTTGRLFALDRTAWLVHATAQQDALRPALAPYAGSVGWDTIYQVHTDHWQNLLRQEPDNRNYRRNLAATLTVHADLLREAGDRARSAACYAEAMTTYRGLLDQDPDNRDYRRELAITLAAHAWLLREAGDRARSAACYAEAMTTYRGLLDQDPDNRDYRRELAITLADHALLLREAGDRARAAACYAEAMTTYRGLLDQDPDNRSYRRGLAITLADHALLLREAGDRARAATCYTEATIIYRILLEGDSDHPGYRSDLGITFADHATLLREAGDLSQAEGLFTRAVELLGGLQRQFPDHQKYRHELAKACNGQALCAADAGSNLRAATLYGEALQLLTAVLTAADLPKHRRELKTTHDNARDFLDNLGQDHDVESLTNSLEAAAQLLRERDAL